MSQHYSFPLQVRLSKYSNGNTCYLISLTVNTYDIYSLFLTYAHYYSLLFIGEHPAAMHHGKSAPLQPPEFLLLVLLSFGLLFFLKSNTLSIHQATTYYNTTAITKVIQQSSIVLVNCRNQQRQRALRNQFDSDHMPPTTQLPGTGCGCSYTSTF